MTMRTIKTDTDKPNAWSVLVPPAICLVQDRSAWHRPVAPRMQPVQAERDRRSCLCWAALSLWISSMSPLGCIVAGRLESGMGNGACCGGQPTCPPQALGFQLSSPCRHTASGVWCLA
jgi:hypothetical protein